MKINSLFLMAGVATLAVSCQEGEPALNLSDRIISVGASLGGFEVESPSSNSSKGIYRVSTRAIETNPSTLDGFYLSSFQTNGGNYMKDVPYSKVNGNWCADDGKFFWPVEGDLHFYGYAPKVPGASGSLTLDSEKQALEGFCPASTAAKQKDFIYAYGKGSLNGNSSSGLSMDFKHALSEITVAAKNDCPDYTVGITGVRIGNIKGKGTFTFPAVGSTNNEGSWSLSNETSDNVSYETTWTNAALLGSGASMMDASNEAFMLLPQKLEKADKASDKAYVALKVNINATSGQNLYNDWAYIGIDTDWKMGKRYDYTLDFTNGAGQQKNGDPVLVLIKGTSYSSEPFSININGGKGVYVDSNGNWVFNVGPYSSVTDMDSMFDGCTSLTSLDVSNLNTSNVTDMDGMFNGCSKLTSLDLSNFNTSKVTNMDGMFQSCTKLTSLDLSGWNTSNVTDMYCMFRHCERLMSLDLTHFNTSQITSMIYMFSYCESLTSLDLSGFDTSQVTSMSRMFLGCESLTTLDLSGWNTSNVADMGSMFNSCSTLKTITMKGCSQETVDKIKAQLAKDYIYGVYIITE